MNRMKRLGSIAFAMIISTGLFAQAKVSVDYTVQRYIGGVSELDRTKYINIHDGSTDSEAQKLANDYNVGRGRGFWAPYSFAKSKTGEVAVYPSSNGGSNTAVRSVSRYVATEHPYNVFKNGMDITAAANWAVEYYKNFVNNGDVPEYFEPMNEPYVHAGEFGSDQVSIRQQMAELYGAIGKAIHEAPELANMKVVGYSSAWPSMELWDFEHWNSRMKMFMDVAGENMDAFSTHLYDGINVEGQDNFRSGSNAEAILDLIETYSNIKWGHVKPHAITEYGGIEDGYGSDWSELRAIQAIKSMNHLIMGLLEREDRMEISIPFITGKAKWHINAGNNYQPYGAVLWIPSNIGEANPTGWVYGPRIYFYELWKDVKGMRVLNASSNPDIQSQAFVDGDKLYLILNNLHDESINVNLNYISDFGSVVQVKQKGLKIWSDELPEYDENIMASVPESIELIPSETVVLEYEFASAIEFTNAIKGKNYYHADHLVQIEGTKTFNFNGIDLGNGSGKAKIKLSIGRATGKDVLPLLIKFNGEYIDIPTNWAGYDQKNRADFFGTLEIPLPFNLMQEDNEISITYADQGGKISSVILNVELFDNTYTSINDKSTLHKSEISVYPTLVKNNVINVDLESNHPYKSVSIIAPDGRELYSVPVTTGNPTVKVNTAGLAKGMYMLSLNADTYRNNKRFVIE